MLAPRTPPEKFDGISLSFADPEFSILDSREFFLSPLPDCTKALSGVELRKVPNSTAAKQLQLSQRFQVKRIKDAIGAARNQDASFVRDEYMKLVAPSGLREAPAVEVHMFPESAMDPYSNWSVLVVPRSREIFGNTFFLCDAFATNRCVAKLPFEPLPFHLSHAWGGWDPLLDASRSVPQIELVAAEFFLLIGLGVLCCIVGWTVLRLTKSLCKICCSPALQTIDKLLELPLPQTYQLISPAIVYAGAESQEILLPEPLDPYDGHREVIVIEMKKSVWHARTSAFRRLLGSLGYCLWSKIPEAVLGRLQTPPGWIILYDETSRTAGVRGAGIAGQAPFKAHVDFLVPVGSVLRRQLVLAASHASAQWKLLSDLAGHLPVSSVMVAALSGFLMHLLVLQQIDRSVYWAVNHDELLEVQRKRLSPSPSHAPYVFAAIASTQAAVIFTTSSTKALDLVPGCSTLLVAVGVHMWDLHVSITGLKKWLQPQRTNEFVNESAVLPRLSRLEGVNQRAECHFLTSSILSWAMATVSWVVLAYMTLDGMRMQGVLVDYSFSQGYLLYEAEAATLQNTLLLHSSSDSMTFAFQIGEYTSRLSLEYQHPQLLGSQQEVLLYSNTQTGAATMTSSVKAGEYEVFLPKGPLYSRIILRAASTLRIKDTVPPGADDSFSIVEKAKLYGSMYACNDPTANRRYVIHLVRIGETVTVTLNGTADVDESSDLNLTVPFHEKRRWSYLEQHVDWHVPELRGNLNLYVELRPICFAPLVGVAPWKVTKYDLARVAPSCDCGSEMPGFGNECLHQEVLTLPGSEACVFLRSERPARGRLRLDDSEGSLSGRGSDLAQWLRDVSISGKSVVLLVSADGSDSSSISWRPLIAQNATDEKEISNLFRLSVPVKSLLMKSTQLLVAATQDPTDAHESALPLRIVPHPPPVYLSTPDGDANAFMLPEFSANNMRTEYTACSLSSEQVTDHVLDSRFEVHDMLVHLGEDCLRDEVKHKRFWVVRKKTDACSECASYRYPWWNGIYDIAVTSSIVRCMREALDFDDNDALNRTVENLTVLTRETMRVENQCNILQVAIRLQRHTMLDLLLKYLNPSCPRSEQTPLGVAAAEGNTAVMESLIAHRAEVNVVDHLDQSALVYALRSCNAPAVDLLMKAKADVNQHMQNSLIKNLVQNHGAALNIQDRLCMKETALVKVVASGNLFALPQLLKLGAPANEAGNNGHGQLVLPLPALVLKLPGCRFMERHHKMSWMELNATANLLIQCKADIDKSFPDAAEQCRVDLVQLLLELGFLLPSPGPEMAAEGEEDGEAVGIRDCLLDLGDAIDPFALSVGIDALAVPHAVWNKAIARRRLPKDALVRAANVEVAARGDPATQAHPTLKVKVWIGYLASDLEAGWSAGGGEEAQYPFRVAGSPGTSALPFFGALQQVAQEQFGYETGNSGPGAVAEDGDPLEGRVGAIEQALGSVQRGLEKLLQQRAADTTSPPPSAPAMDGRLLLDERGADEGLQLPPMERAVLEMGAVLQRLAKREDRPKTDLEDILDRADGLGSGSADAFGSGGTARSNAAAYLRLCRLLREEPERIVESISRLVEEDFTGLRSAPGASQQTATMRAGVEHRSHLPALAGRSVVLGRGRDSGQLGGSELLFEQAAPLQSFSRHRAPEAHEQQHTKILDPRRISVALSRLKEREAFMEVRRKLGGGSGRPSGGASGGAAEAGEKEKVIVKPPGSDHKTEPWAAAACASARNPPAFPVSGSSPSMAPEPSIEMAQAVTGASARNPASFPATGSFELPIGEVSDVASLNALGRSSSSPSGAHVLCTTRQHESAHFSEASLGPGFSSGLEIGQGSAEPLEPGEPLVSHATGGQSSGPAAAPGSGASTFKPADLWHDFFSCLGSASTSFSTFWHSLDQIEGPWGAYGPCPCPFLPSLHRAKAKRQQPDAARKLGLNALVLALSWLSLGCPAVAPPYLGLGGALSRGQWATVKRLSVNVSAWNAAPPVDWTAMGRSAAKVESTKGGFAGACPTHQHEPRTWRDPVLWSRIGQVAYAPCLECGPQPHFLHGVPTFDPRPVLGPTNRLAFERPLTWAASDKPLKPVPSVKLHCKREQLRGFLELLDSGDRLELFPLRCVDYSKACGVFAVAKDSDRDRLVLEEWLVPGLRTVAMGDTAAVGLAQSERVGIINGVRSAYKTVGLPRHEKKAVEGACEGEFWGCAFDGRSGRARPSPKRAVPFGFLVLQLVTVGQTSAELLDSLVGGLVSCFQYRRRLLCLLQHVYSDPRPKDRSAPFPLSAAAKGELLASVALLPQCDIDLRARPAPFVIAADASMEAEAGVICPVPAAASQELYRHSLSKGLWNKLLSAVAAYRCEHGDLDSSDELPGFGEQYASHPLWDELALSQPFGAFGRIVRVQQRRHINIGEMRAAIRAESRLARLHHDIRYVHLQDSQVSLAAMTKGRSSSKALNCELQRNAPLRPPSRAGSRWFLDFLAGDLCALVSAPALRTSQHIPVDRAVLFCGLEASNEASDWALDVSRTCASSGSAVLVEHPRNSMLWKLSGWAALRAAAGWKAEALDMCRFGSPARKSTRVLTFGIEEMGEAAVPGPRRTRFRVPQELAAVSLVEPATVALRTRYWTAFSEWIDAAAGDGASCLVVRVPQLLVKLLVAFSQHLYDAGTPLTYYRQLVAHVQREVPGSRPWIRDAWEFVSRWELLEPLQHRPPLPEPLLHAMCSVAVLWGWKRWAATTLGAFYAICRPGEFVRAMRDQLLTSADLLETGQEFFLRIPEPKTRRRGARVQHARIKAPEFILKFLGKVFQPLAGSCALYPGSPNMYRRRWDSLLKALLVEPTHRLTPGSLRGGGAVRAFRGGEPLSEVQWRMRLRHQETLGYYLQEVTALSVLPSLSSPSRNLVQGAAAAFPFVLEAS
ncbi:Fem1b [Symbiodinium sp. CCMP2592]|nr:Fem1b [Symbiodinium sp. CCMP2592]